VFLPVILLPGFALGRFRQAALYIAPWSGLPAIALVLLSPGGFTIDIPWLLLGMQLGMDSTGQIFLLFTAILWTAAGLYARGYFKGASGICRFFAYYLTAMTGNFGLILAQDMMSFYLFFTMMSFASYGLVVFNGTAEARRAGLIYVILVLLGEVLLISAFFLSAEAVDNLEFQKVAAGIAGMQHRDLIFILILTGFGIKAGLLPLHVWLPLAHPVAPTPASAVLSGAMIKAGLIGWMRFLPADGVTWPFWGEILITLGLAAAFLGVIAGLLQANPKTVLAYSSISQMGFITSGIGMGLVSPESWPVAISAVLIYALHHALAKGTLFLSVGIINQSSPAGWLRIFIITGIVLTALALAGAPLTSGAVAKAGLKSAVTSMPSAWPTFLKTLLPLAAVGTSVLMGRFLFLLIKSKPKKQSDHSVQLLIPWFILLVCVLTVTWLQAPETFTAKAGMFSMSAWWPVVTGTLLTWLFWKNLVGRRLDLKCPPGDLLVMAIWFSRKSKAVKYHNKAVDELASMTVFTDKIRAWCSERLNSSQPFGITAVESRFRFWPIGGLLFVSIVTILLVLLNSSQE
jgi:formate hydrogenlyase subunit 3/multisubunit Na+/H+ antiporter MnhD subunit